MHAYGVTIDADAEAATSLESQLEQRQTSTHSLARALSRMNNPRRDSSWLYRRDDRERYERERALALLRLEEEADEQDS